jgi:hypothetical protein
MSKFRPKQLAAQYTDAHKYSNEDRCEEVLGDSVNQMSKVCESAGERSVLEEVTSVKERENCKSGLSTNLDTAGTTVKVSEPLLENFESCAEGNSSNGITEDIKEVKSFCKYKDKNIEKDLEASDSSEMNMGYPSEIDVRSSVANEDTQKTGPSQIMKTKAKGEGIKRKIKAAPAPRMKLQERGRAIKVNSDCVVNTEFVSNLKDGLGESEVKNDVNVPVTNEPSESEVQKISSGICSASQSQSINVEEKGPLGNESEIKEVNDIAVIEKFVSDRRRGRPKKTSLCSMPNIPQESSSPDTETISPSVTEEEIECGSLPQEELVAKKKTRLRRSSLEIRKALKEDSDEKLNEENVDTGNVLQDCNGKLAPVKGPRKRKKSTPEEDITKIYTSKNYVPIPTKAIETIYESPVASKKSRKLKRLIDFGSLYYIQPVKQKRRQQKAVKMGWDPRKARKNKIPDDIAQQKLQSVWEELEKDQ